MSSPLPALSSAEPAPAARPATGARGHPRPRSDGSRPASRGARAAATPASTLTGRGAPLIEQIDRAGLRGRGGGGFPTAAKMRAVAASRRPSGGRRQRGGGRAREPQGSDPHPSTPPPRARRRHPRSTRARERRGRVCVCESARASIEGVTGAISERGSTGRRSPRIRLRTVPAHYVAGHESALVNHLNGGPAIPTFTPPMPFQQGVERRPTFIGNAETLAHVALIARHGPTWFRELGTPSQTGSTLVTLSGPVAHPGVYEIEYRAPLASLIRAAGGTTARPGAALLGGYGGSWIGGESLDDLILSDEHLAPFGASIGAGVVLLLSEAACPVAETARVARWLADQSTGQCGPCVHGLDAIATGFHEIAGDSRMSGPPRSPAWRRCSAAGRPRSPRRCRPADPQRDRDVRAGARGPRPPRAVRGVSVRR